MIWIVAIFILILAAKRDQKVAIRTAAGHHRRLSSEVINRNSNSFSLVTHLRKSFSKPKKEMNNSIEDPESENLNEVASQNSHIELAISEVNSHNSHSELPFNKLKQKSDVFHFTYDYENGNILP